MIRELINTSLSEQLAPETILELPGQWIFIQPKESALRLWKEVQAKRFPRLCHTLGILRPHRMASMVEPLYHDILSGVKEKGGRPIKGLAKGVCSDALKEIAYSGISLTCFVLGQGNMLYK